MMTTGNESMLLVSRVIGNGVAEWYGTTEWTCDVVPFALSGYPDLQLVRPISLYGADTHEARVAMLHSTPTATTNLPN